MDFYTPKTPYTPETAQAVEGKLSVLFFRILKNATTKPAVKMAFQLEHEASISNDTDSTMTKDGAIVTNKGTEIEFPFSFIASKNNPLIEELEMAAIKGETVEMWEVDVDPDMVNAANEFRAKYMQGKLGEWSTSKNVDDSVEVSSSLAVIGVYQKGYVELTAEQQQAVQYVFKNLEQQSE